VSYYQPNPYRVLGLAPSASLAEVKRAYRRLVTELHPDHHPDDPQALKRFYQVQDAYELLGDATRKAAYDKTQAPSPWQPAPPRPPRPAAPAPSAERQAPVWVPPRKQPSYWPARTVLFLIVAIPAVFYASLTFPFLGHHSSPTAPFSIPLPPTATLMFTAPSCPTHWVSVKDPRADLEAAVATTAHAASGYIDLVKSAVAVQDHTGCAALTFIEPGIASSEQAIIWLTLAYRGPGLSVSEQVQVDLKRADAKTTNISTLRTSASNSATQTADDARLRVIAVVGDTLYLRFHLLDRLPAFNSRSPALERLSWSVVAVTIGSGHEVGDTAPVYSAGLGLEPPLEMVRQSDGHVINRS
jgi:hypothetical protein